MTAKYSIKNRGNIPQFYRHYFEWIRYAILFASLCTKMRKSKLRMEETATHKNGGKNVMKFKNHKKTTWYN